MMETIKGTIKSYIYFNESNNYSVIKLDNDVVAVGNLPEFEEGQNVQFEGEWVLHKFYGTQFKVSGFEILLPNTLKGISRFLASGIIEGIGEKTADKIIQKFGEETLNILDSEPDRLKEIEGIGSAKLESIKRGWKQQNILRDVMIFLQSAGISTNLSLKIFKEYSDKTIEVVKNNPYKIINDIWGVGFKTADDLASKIGFPKDDTRRIKAGLLYILSEAMRNGHTYLPETELMAECEHLLNYQMGIDDPLLIDLEEESYIKRESNNVYLSYLYFAERRIEEKLNHLIRIPPQENIIQKSMLSSIENRFSEEQFNAILSTVQNKVSIITGGPGTGKTTAIRGIIELYRSSGKRILLAAPTGRAAKRITELIGLEAKTIHRLLEYNPLDNTFNFDEENQLTADLIVIDEVSMIDILLMYNLISAIDLNTNVVFVGDVDQLPSVGPGNVLHDFISCDILPVTKLTQIFRQAEASEIVKAAHKINHGEIPIINNSEESDLFFISENDQQKIAERILQLSSENLPRAFGYDPVRDIQILTPMYKGIAGADNINDLFQNEINKNPVAVEFNSLKFKVGDKVMQLRNNYDKGIFNGDVGFVMNWDREKRCLIVDFSGMRVEYEQTELNELTLAYCITVHKSQGSEFPCIILIQTMQHYRMLQRNLLYTGVTRAEKHLIIIGAKKALTIAVNNNTVQKRYSSLFK